MKVPTPTAPFFVALLALGACGGGGGADKDSGDLAIPDCEGVPETQAPAVIDTPTEWSCTVRIDGDIRVQDTLTIAPCTRVLMGDRMFVNEGGSVVARGTKECPIAFTSPNGTPGPGDWRYIIFEAGADNGNVLEHVILEYGGDEHGIVTAEDSIGVAFRDVQVRHTEALGLGIEALEIQDFDRVSFSDIPGYPVRMHVSTLDEIEDITVADSVQEPRILGIMGSRGPVTIDTTIAPQSVPYELSSLTFRADVRVEAGTTIQVTPNARFFTEDGGNLFLDGTAEAPVIWESAAASPSPGDWQEITINNSSGTESTFTHAILRHGGSDGLGVIYVQTGAQITLTEVTFEDNATCDVEDDGDVLGDSTYVACD